MKLIQTVRYIFGIVIFAIIAKNGCSKVLRLSTIKKWTSSAITSASILFSPILSAPTQAVDDGLQLQLKIMRQQQIEAQKSTTQTAEEELMSKELLYPEKLIARGMVLLTPNDPNKEFDRVNFPLGLMKSGDLSELLLNDDASLFVLAVGREGPPVAALKYKLNSLSFPFVFEVTTDNLLFPYTADAWSRSTNSKDSVAITAIISLDDKLATPSDAEWVGFAISDPVQIAGTLGRTTAKVEISNRINKNLYTQQEIESLSSVDRALEALLNPPKPATSKNL